MSGDASDSPRTRTGLNEVGTEVRTWSAPGWWPFAAAAAIAWLTWPIPSITVESGLDTSWQLALHLSADQRLSFGRDIVFTYGPLGFLAHPRLVTAPTAVTALVFAAFAQFSICAIVLCRALRSFSWYVAVALTYVVGAMLAASGFSNLGDYTVFAVLALVVRILEDPQPAPAWILPLGAFLASFQLLVKISGGFVALGLLATAAWHVRPSGARAEALLLGMFSAFLCALWLVSGGSFGELGTWLHQSIHVITAYSDAMALDAASKGFYLEAVLLLGIAAWLITLQQRGVGGWRTRSLGAACALYGFAYFKEGFVRFDFFHAVLFFSAFAVGVLTITWTERTRWVALSLVATCLGATATAVGGNGFLYSPGSRMGTAMDELALTADSGREIRAARATIRRELALDKATLAALRGKTVDVEPYETSAVWAYGFNWHPQPLIQSYVALDHELDVFNAHALHDRGPERVLYQREKRELDGRNPLYVAPESYFVLLCHYRSGHSTRKWQTLLRTSDRCGSTRSLGSAVTVEGENVRVPRTSSSADVVFARIQIDEPFGERLTKFVFKPRRLAKIVVGGEAYRLVADIARGPLIMRMPQVATIGMPVGTEINISHLALLDVPSPYRVDFFAVRLRR
jgi:hypothetical protein